MHHLTLLLATALALPAAAGVVSRDLFEPGDGLLTYDDVNQREWLDFSVTSQLFDPSNRMSVTLPASLASFELATLDEVGAFMGSASITQVDAWSVPSTANTTVDLIELMGESGRFSGSILGDLVFSGGYVAIDTATPLHPEDIVAVLPFKFGVDRIPGALNRPPRAYTSGYYRFTMADYLFGQGPVDLDFSNGNNQGGSDRLADDLNGNGNAGVTRVLGPDGEVIGLINDFGDLYEFNVFYNRIQGAPAYWLYRDAAPIPEPTTACLTLAACLAAWRLRVFA